LFDGLLIAEHKEFVRNFCGVFPVGFLDFSGIQSESWAEMYQTIWIRVQEMVNRHSSELTEALAELKHCGLQQNTLKICNVKPEDIAAFAPAMINSFVPWSADVAKNYVSRIINLSTALLETILVDEYRPRILENLVQDLLNLGVNYIDAADLRNQRLLQESRIDDLELILKSSYNAVIQRFNKTN